MTTFIKYQHVAVRSKIVNWYKRTSPANRIDSGILNECITKLMIHPVHTPHGNSIYKKCTCCGTYHNPQDTFFYGGEYYCLSCQQSEFFTCACCGYIKKRGTGYRTHDGIVCRECKDSYYKSCEHCGIRFKAGLLIYSENTAGHYCHPCYADTHFVCIECNTPAFGLQQNICSKCAEFNNPLHSYSYKPKPIFLSMEKDEAKVTGEYYGVEIESYSINRSRNTVCAEIQGLFNSHKFKQIRSNKRQKGLETFVSNKLVYNKEDGSLSDISGAGIEMVFNPMSFDLISKCRIFDQFKKTNNLTAYKYQKTGLHIHVSRSSFTTLQLAKVCLFINSNKNFVEFIAQRTANTYCKFEEGTNDILRTIRRKRTSCDRYVWINITEKTVEFRGFKSNLSPERIYKNIEFLKALKDWCKITPIDKLHLTDFLRYVTENRVKFSHLNSFAKKYDFIEEI